MTGTNQWIDVSLSQGHKNESLQLHERHPFRKYRWCPDHSNTYHPHTMAKTYTNIDQRPYPVMDGRLLVLPGKYAAAIIMVEIATCVYATNK